MKLFKVTYEKLCHPSEGIFVKEYQGYYFCHSLDRLYNYIENEQHLTVKNIEILDCTLVEQEFKPIKKYIITIVAMSAMIYTAALIKTFK